MPRRFFRLLSEKRFFPWKVTLPEKPGRVPERIEMSVVLPAPLGPRSPRTSPLSMSREKRSKAGASP